MPLSLSLSFCYGGLLCRRARSACCIQKEANTSPPLLFPVCCPAPYWAVLTAALDWFAHVVPACEGRMCRFVIGVYQASISDPISAFLKVRIFSEVCLYDATFKSKSVKAGRTVCCHRKRKGSNYCTKRFQRCCLYSPFTQRVCVKGEQRVSERT